MEKLYKDHQPHVYRRALVAARGDNQAAEDLTHEVFYKILKGFGTELLTMPAARVRSILHKTLGWLAVDRWRENGNLVLLEEYHDNDIPCNGHRHTPEPAETAIANVTIERFWKAIETNLRFDEFVLAFMRWGAGMSPAEIAKTLHTTPTAVTTRCHKLRRKIETLGGNEIRFTDTATGDLPDTGTDRGGAV
jgi:RNA polymerase sigma factor (sigma-70 family)